MVDWMMDAFFIFAGLRAGRRSSSPGRPGTSTTSSRPRAIPLVIHEEDYYTPEWALDEEEWADGDAQR